ncbi:MAG: hypothetical protein IT210_01585 [Armatimonadetes bacterium]|nr:hypothetical protein [Armatimonadota bacterium]
MPFRFRQLALSLLLTGILSGIGPLFAAPVRSVPATPEAWRNSIRENGIVPEGTAQAQDAQTERGADATDILRGNGTRSGYLLSHGNVYARSESVSVNGMRKVRDRDYVIDYTTGSITFMDGVSTYQSIRVSYRHKPGDSGPRSLAGTPALRWNLSKFARFNFVSGYQIGNRAADPNAVDILTYGANANWQLGKKSFLNSMLYVSAPKGNGGLVGTTAGGRFAQANPGASDARADKLMLQQGSFDMGALKLTANYQKVGEKFDGFQALQDSQAAPAELLNQLVKERGLQRIDVGGELTPVKGLVAKTNFNTVEDKEGNSILWRGIAFQTARFSFEQETVTVDERFNRFQDLREGNRDQLAREKGLERLNRKMQATLSKDLGMSVVENEVKDKQGAGIRKRVIEIKGKNFGIARRQQIVDESFARFNDIAEADRGQLAKERGLTRDGVDLTWQLNKGMALTASESSIRGTGGDALKRTDWQLMSKNFLFNMNRRSLAEGFTRMKDLTPQEWTQMAFDALKAYDSGFNAGQVNDADRQQVQKEAGLKRVATVLKLDTKSAAIFLSDTNIADKSGQVARKHVEVSGKNFQVTANQQEIDKGFARVGDLVERDRAQMAQEIGFKRFDINTKLNLKAANLDSFYYDAVNHLDRLRNSVWRNNLVLTPGKFSKVTIFQDKRSNRSDEGLKLYGHSSYFLEQILPKNMYMTFFTENLKNTEFGALTDARRTTRMHFNTDAARRTALIFDHQNMSLFGDRRDDIRNLQLTHQVNKGMNFRGILYDHDQGQAGVEKTKDMLLNWQMNKSLAFTGNVIDKNFEEQGSQEIRNFKLEGSLAPRLQMGTTFAQTVTRTGQGQLIDKTDVAMNVASQVSRQTKLIGTLVQAATPEGKVGKYSRNAGIETLLGGYRVGATYGDNYVLSGPRVTRHSYSFSSDPDPNQPDPKKWYHLSGFYMLRRGDPNLPRLGRQYSLSMNLGKLTQFEMKYINNPLENPQLLDGKIVPVRTSYYKLTRSLGKLNLIADYRENDDMNKRVHQLQSNLGFSGKLSAQETFEVYFGLDDLLNASGRLSARTYKLVYDRQIDARRYFSLSAVVRDLDNHNPQAPAANEIEARLDLASIF